MKQPPFITDTFGPVDVFLIVRKTLIMESKKSFTTISASVSEVLISNDSLSNTV